MTQGAGRYSPLGLVSLALDHARLLVLVPLAALILSVGFTALTGQDYTARASFTPQSRQSETARLAGLASQFGLNMSSLGGDGESVDFYARLARSRALLEQVALREYRFAKREASADTVSGTLLEVLGIDGRNERERRLTAVRALERMTTVDLDMSANVITLSTRARWAGLAEQINRALLDEINRFNMERRQSHAAAERRFVEEQITRAQTDLGRAESELGTFLQHNRRYEEWPQLRFEAARLQRRVELQQQVYTTLAQRLEQARVDEVRNTPVITIIDTPEGSSQSEASLVKNGLLSMIVAVGLVIGFLLVREYGMRLQLEHPEDYERVRTRGRKLLPRRRNRLPAALLPLLLPLLSVSACDDGPVGPDAPGNFTVISTGGDHSCAVNETGRAYCWGRGEDGELGFGGAANSAVPVRVATELRLVDIAAGAAHTCALAADGRAYCWGWNVYYQRGNAFDPHGTAPVAVTGDRQYTMISAGLHHTCALATDGTAFCWGYNLYGQLGDGTYNTSIEPQPVAGGRSFVTIEAGAWHTCAVAPNGTAYCWGRNDQGQLGIGSDSLRLNQPAQVAASVTFTEVSAGTNHSCALSGSQAFCWGGAEHGQLGDGGAFRPGLPGPNRPVRSAERAAFQQISAGEYVTCGVTTDWIGLCWGRGMYGQLGSGIETDSYHPQEVELYGGGSHFRMAQIDAAGSTHACGISAGNALYCWGTGTRGQLGSARHTYAMVPVRVRAAEEGIR